MSRIQSKPTIFHPRHYPRNQNAQKVNRKLNILQTLLQNRIPGFITFIAKYKWSLRPTLNYASLVRYLGTFSCEIKKLQRRKKKFQIITGYTKTTAIQHLHKETNILPILNHLDMIGTQFYSSTIDQSHSYHHNLQDTQDHLKITSIIICSILW